jgi:hypothetical protein
MRVLGDLAFLEFAFSITLLPNLKSFVAILSVECGCPFVPLAAVVDELLQDGFELGKRSGRRGVGWSGCAGQYQKEEPKAGEVDPPSVAQEGSPLAGGMQSNVRCAGESEGHFAGFNPSLRNFALMCLR